MKLHEDKEMFKFYINTISNATKYDRAFIEKDYYVTLLLGEINSRIPDHNLFFKGGTSLSKCHKIIDRFSEDIDLTLSEEYKSLSRKAGMKQIVIDSCNSLGLEIINLDRIRSKKNYNNYQINYPIMFSSATVKPYLLAEITFLSKSFPSEIKQASSIISEYLQNTGNDEEVYKYDMQPFYIRTQTLDRTLVDKVFAISDYYERKEVQRNSRHIYDIYKILPQITFDDKLRNLIYDVREDRKTGVTKSRSVTAADGYDVPSTLQKIIDEHFYEDDYNKVTGQMLYKPLSYSEAIKGIEMVIESGFFVEMKERIPMIEPSNIYKSPKQLAEEKLLNYRKISMEGRGEDILNPSDRVIYERAKNCKKKERFRALYNGNTVFHDEYKDEVALIQHIAICTDDKEQVKRIFMSSGQCRETNDTARFDRAYNSAKKAIDKIRSNNTANNKSQQLYKPSIPNTDNNSNGKK